MVFELMSTHTLSSSSSLHPFHLFSAPIFSKKQLPTSVLWITLTKQSNFVATHSLKPRKSPSFSRSPSFSTLSCYAHDPNFAPFPFLPENSPPEPTGFSPRGFASLAEASEVAMSSTGVSFEEEFQQLLEEMRIDENNGTVSEFVSEDWLQLNKNSKKYQTLKKRQVEIETEAWEQAAEEYKQFVEDMCQMKLAPNLPYIKKLFLGWFEPLRDAIAEEQESILLGKSRDHSAHYFVQLPAQMMAVITMYKLMGLIMTGAESHYTPVSAASCIIGDAIEQEVRIQKFLEKKKKKRVGNGNEVEVGESDDTLKDEEKLQKKVTDLIKKQKLPAVRRILESQDYSKPWSRNAKAKVGCRLIELLIETAYVQYPSSQHGDGPPDVRPAFVHTSRTTAKGNKYTNYGVIQCDPIIRKGLDKAARHMVIPYMPMLVPPVKWTGYDKGGHLFLPSMVMRTHGARLQREVLERTPRKQLQQVFEALDTLGETKWRINKKILSVVDRIWNCGGQLANMVDHNDVPLPDKPDTEDEALLKKWKFKVRYVEKENRERHSKRSDTELKLSVAWKMKDEEGFYYPHNLDFRGRAYPLHPYLNHLGSDLCRGLLEFAEGRPLGKSGLRWLKIHLANVFSGGVDKLSYEGRISFTENHLDDIFDSAENPLEGRRWWLNAEDPFQCLATCINLTEALRSSCPETFISHIPIHQDGSCNGLQHYAALGRDKLGAVAVNLVAAEKPADIYSEIAARVREIMEQDAQKDPGFFPNALYAKMLINEVDRKLVKQTVMTSVYGVTFIGAREQIKRRLEERVVIEKQEIFGASWYAAKVTLTALKEMFEAARRIMNWLSECAKIIASENKSVQWTTPLGLPVVQPYHKHKQQFVKTSLQILTLKKETNKVMVKRQRAAFPPNFVHSLDGSHMMMTALACKKAGLCFAGVHDSYWTHACDVDLMNRILREKFVELHETPILENLVEEFRKACPTLNFPPIPERGDFDLRNVLDSPYFFN